MKQRLLLALLMLFTSVGFVMGQDSRIQITISGSARIDLLGSGMTEDDYPKLMNAGDTEVRPNGLEEVGTQLTYTLTTSGGTQTYYFENPSETKSWSGLTMNISGPVTSFVVTGSGSLSNAISSLNIQTNGQQTLETLTLGTESDELGYMSKLTSLSCGNNKLKHIPATKDGLNYSVGSQYPEGITPIQLSRNGGTGDNKFAVKISSEQLKGTGLFSKDITNYEIRWDLTNYSMTGNVEDGYLITDKNTGVYLDGTFNVRVEIDNADQNYPGVNVYNIPVVIPKAEFSLTTTAVDAADGTIKAYTDEDCNDEITSDTKLTKDQHIWIKIEANDGQAISKVERKGLTLATVFSEAVPGTYEYVVTGTGDASLTVTFEDIVPGSATLLSFTSDEGEIEVWQQDGNAEISSAKRGSTVFAKVKPTAGYLVDGGVKVVGGANATITTLGITGDADGNGWYSTKSYTIPTGEEDMTYGFVGLFKRGATVDVTLGTGATTGEEVTIQTSTPTVETIEENSTVEPGTKVTITVPDAATGYAIASVTNNGQKCDLVTSGSYETELAVGVNNIEVTYEDVRVTELLIFGIDKNKVEVYKGENKITDDNLSSVKAGDELTIEFTGLAADEKVEGVSVNAQDEVTSGTYKGTAVAGVNTIFVRMASNPTLGEPKFYGLEGSIETDDLVSVTQNGESVAVDGALAEGDVTITVKDVTGYSIERVLFNGIKLDLANDVYKGDVVSGLNTVTVYYKSTAVGDVEYEFVGGGDASWITKDEATLGQVKISASNSIQKGKGIQAVLLNALNSEEETGDYVEYTDGAYVVTLQPGNNLITVVFTDKALIETHVEGVEGYAGGSEIAITSPQNYSEGSTYEVGEELAFTVKPTIEYSDIDYSLQAVYINGESQNVLGEDGTYTDALAVGTNHIVAVYESQAATVVEPILVGTEGTAPTITYYVNDGGTGYTTIPTGLNAGDKLSFEVTDAGNNTLDCVYFNNEPVQPTGGKYEVSIEKGNNTLYAFFNEAAVVKTVVTDGGTIAVEPTDPKMKKGTTISATIEASDGYRIKAVYFNGETVKGDLDDDGKLSDLTVQSGLNIIHAEFEYVAATVNLTYNSSIGSVTTSPELDPEEGNTKYEAGQVITIIPSVDAEDYNRITVTINGSTEGVTNNGNDTYTVTLQAGVNNIHVDFARALAGNLLVKYPDAEVSDVTIYDLNGNDVATTVANGDYVEAPADTKLEVTFKVDKPANKLISAVVNGQLYSLTPDENDVCRIGSSGTTDDIVILPEGESVLRIYVKELVEPSITPVTTYAYDGTAKAVEYATYPAGLNNIEVYYRPEGGAEWRTEPYAEAGSYEVMFKRAADANYAEVNTETSPTTITINQAHLIITQLPTVTRDEATNKYVLAQDGKAGYYVNGSLKSVAGTFELEHFTHESGEHYAEVGFTTNEEDDNLDRNTITGIKVHYNVKSYTGGHYTLTVDNSGTPFYLMCGDAIIDSNDLLDPSASIAALYDPQPGFEYALYQVKDGEETIVPTGNDGKFLVSDICNSSNTSATLKLKATDKRQVLAVKDGKFEIEDAVYNGQPQFFNPSSVALVVGEDKKAVASDSQAYGRLIVTYKDAKGNTVIAPVDAGTYTVTLSYNDDDMYKDFKPVSAIFEIEKVNLDDVLIGDPVATPITAGQSLRNSHLAGPAEIPGQYQWLDETAIPTSDSDGGTNQPAKFVPVDKTNFTSYRHVGKVHVKILKGVQVVTYNANLGTISVVDDQNISYKSGSQVQPETKLTITAKPLDATMQQFESMTITIGEETKTYTTSTATITFPEAGEGNVEIYATFKLKEKDPVIIPEGQYAVVLPESVRGARVDKSGVYAVERGDDFTFTVTTLAADAGKVTVTVNGSALTGTNGKYTLTNVTERQDISISVSNPTEVKVNIPRSYHIEGQSEDYATVSVINNTANDGHYYFNDALTVIAFTHITGVDFARWSDNSREQVHEVVLDAAEYTLLASFTGLPTGIEDIESATVYTGKGFIMVKNVADAELTVVSISGRLQAKQEISGDTRIDVPQGIYVVVLQSGDEVKQLKVIVK